MQNIYSLKIFNWLNKGTIDFILKNSKIEKFSSWEIILLQWENSNWKWYIIKSWEVEVEIWWKNITILWVWEIFWEIALLNEEERTATVKANTNVELIVLTQENLFEIINSWNETINKDIMKRIEENLNNN